jgi:hypothetical protein
MGATIATVTRSDEMKATTGDLLSTFEPLAAGPVEPAAIVKLLTSVDRSVVTDDHVLHV